MLSVVVVVLSVVVVVLSVVVVDGGMVSGGCVGGSGSWPVVIAISTKYKNGKKFLVQRLHNVLK